MPFEYGPPPPPGSKPIQFNTQQKPDERGFMERMGGIKGLAATGVRVGTGFGSGVLASAPGLGTLMGGALGGGGESLAQYIEGSPQNSARIGVEAALGMVPMGKVFTAGRMLKSALMGGAQAGIGTAGRQYAMEGDLSDISPRAVGESALIGGAMGGSLSKMMGPRKSGGIPPAVVERSGVGGPGGGRGPDIRNVPREPPPAPTTPPSSPGRQSTLTPPYALQALEEAGQPVPTYKFGDPVDYSYPPYPPNTDGPLPVLPPPPRAEGSGVPYRSEAPTSKTSLKGLSDSNKAQIGAADQEATDQFKFQEGIRKDLDDGLGRAPGSREALDDIDTALAQAEKEARAARTLSEREEMMGRRQEATADLAQLRAEQLASRQQEAADKQWLARLEKEAEVKRKTDLIESKRTAAGVTAQDPSFSKSVSAPDPEGGTQSMRTTFKAKDAEGGGVDDLADVLGVGPSSGGRAGAGAPGIGGPPNPVTPAAPAAGKLTVKDIPPEGQARDIYFAWRKKGRDHKEALKLATKGTKPVGMGGNEGAIDVTPVAQPQAQIEAPPNQPSPEVDSYQGWRAAGKNHKEAWELSMAGQKPPAPVVPEVPPVAAAAEPPSVGVPGTPPAELRAPVRMESDRVIAARQAAQPTQPAPIEPIPSTTGDDFPNLSRQAGPEDIEDLSQFGGLSRFFGGVENHVPGQDIAPLVTPRVPPTRPTPPEGPPTNLVKNSEPEDWGALQRVSQGGVKVEENEFRDWPARTVSPELEARARAGDPAAQQEIHDIETAWRGPNVTEDPSGFPPTTGNNAPVIDVAPVQPTAPEGPVPELARFFKSRVDAAGQGNRDIKAAKAAGEKVPEEGRAAAGKALQREAAAVGLPTRPPLPKEPKAPAAPLGSARQEGETKLAHLRRLDREARSGPAAAPPAIDPTTPPADPTPPAAPEGGGSFMDGLKKLGGDETGIGRTELLHSLMGGTVGAAIGGAADPFDNPIVSAAAGGFAGAMAPHIPQILQAIGATSDNFLDLKDRLREPGGARSVAADVVRTLPAFLRFNYLADLRGLGANAYVAPYGAVLTGAIEAGLSGDPRGWAALKTLKPNEFISDLHASWDEAKGVIQRGDLGRSESEASARIPALSAPGTLMTAGDMVARERLMRAGFSEAEARTMTMTGEAEFSGLRKIQNLGKPEAGEKPSVFDTAMEMALPFKRTPVNVGEQGSMRLPVVGPMIQSSRQKGMDPWRAVGVQQGMGLAAGGLGYAAGSTLDPETAKWARRYGTNAAGRYALPFGMAFAAGQAGQRGGDQKKAAFTQGIEDAMPLPTTDAARDLYNMFTEGTLPRGMMPPDIRDVMFPPADPNPVNLPALPRFPTRFLP